MTDENKDKNHDDCNGNTLKCISSTRSTTNGHFYALDISVSSYSQVRAGTVGWMNRISVVSNYLYKL